VTLYQEKPAFSLSVNILLSSVAGAMPNSACRSFDTAVLMSSSHRLFILYFPHQVRPPLMTARVSTAMLLGSCHW
jgi:hypothetical protein